jgi:hypothetical protein
MRFALQAVGARESKLQVPAVNYDVSPGRVGRTSSLLRSPCSPRLPHIASPSRTLPVVLAPLRPRSCDPQPALRGGVTPPFPPLLSSALAMTQERMQRTPARGAQARTHAPAIRRRRSDAMAASLWTPPTLWARRLRS